MYFRVETCPFFRFFASIVKTSVRPYVFSLFRSKKLGSVSCRKHPFCRREVLRCVREVIDDTDIQYPIPSVVPFLTTGVWVTVGVSL